MANNSPAPPSSLLDYLPAIYQDDPLIGQFLIAFEKILIGEGEETLTDEGGESYSQKSLEAVIAGIASLFDPRQTPTDFLPWLANWTAFSLRADLDESQQREFISNIIQLYKWRGTKNNLKLLLALFTGGQPEIIEIEEDKIQSGVTLPEGMDVWQDGGPPHYFQVIVALPEADIDTTKRRLKIANDLIELEKPAHTFYDLFPEFHGMEIGVRCKVGVDTLIGTITEQS